MRKHHLLILMLLILAADTGCYRMRKSRGGGQVGEIAARHVNSTDIALFPGFRIEAVATGLTFPTGAAFDDRGNLYVIEAGYSYGEVWTEPRLLRIDSAGKAYELAIGPRNGPWSGITWHQGAFYIAEGGELNGGRILQITPDGTITPLVSGLPSMGDHHTNGPAIRDGYIYFGVGVATNSAVVGMDNYEFGWLKRQPAFHDIPCGNIVLNGQNFTTGNPLTEDPDDLATTGAYLPFGTSSTDGQVITGSVPCTGAIMRIPLSGGNPELVAWGFRNPFGLAFSRDGRLYVTENGYDDRGSRPIWGTPDVLWSIEEGKWYGWPDFAAGVPVSVYEVPGKRDAKPLLKNYPNDPPRPVAKFGVHASANGLDFSFSEDFGFRGEAFVAEFGDMAPKTGKVISPVGFKIVRVDIATGVVRDFAVNRGKRNGPATWLGRGGLERPVAVKFNPSGEALYIVDFGIVKMTEQGPQPQTGTGMVWKITRQ